MKWLWIIFGCHVFVRTFIVGGEYESGGGVLFMIALLIAARYGLASIGSGPQISDVAEQ